MLHVYGSLQAKGKVADSVWFTAANKTTGWQGIHIHKNSAKADSNLIEWCRIDYVKYFNYTVVKAISKGHGAILCDSIDNFAIRNTLFTKNTSNLGCGIGMVMAKGTISDCKFFDNYCTDTRGSNGAWAIGSAILTGSSTVTIGNCEFIKNTCRIPGLLDDSTERLSKGTLYIIDGKVSVKNCIFKENSATQSAAIHIIPTSSSDYLIENCEILSNYTSSRAVIHLDEGVGVVSQKMKISGCTFRNNKRGNANKNIYQAISLLINSSNKYITVENCTFDSENGGTSCVLRKVVLDRCKFINCDLMAVRFSIYDANVVKNCLFSNNGLAILVQQQAWVSIFNSTIAYNGSHKNIGIAFVGGIAMESNGYYSIFNSIIQNNYSNIGLSNLISHTKYSEVKYIFNSIVQGGLDSAKIINDASAKISFFDTSGIFNDTVRFVNPPQGIGPGYFNSKTDFHTLNSCDYVFQGINKGKNYLPIDDGFNAVLLKDLDGNPRLHGDFVDLGAYEYSNIKGAVGINEQPKDQTICPKTPITARAKAFGADLTYQWESSNNGTQFSPIKGATDSTYSFSPTDSMWIRLVITQKECKLTDSSKAAKIAFKPNTKLTLLANLKDTLVCIKDMLDLKASVSNANSWQWQYSKDGVQYSNIPAATTNPYTTSVDTITWYRILAKNTQCTNLDTFEGVKIGTNPLPKPNLGGDITLENNENKVLNPGTFRSYIWNNGASTPTLTVDKNNLLEGPNELSVWVTDFKGCKGGDTLMITLNKSIGLNNPSDVGVRVYPVPVEETLHIDIPVSVHSGNYKLSNMEGRIILSGSLSQTRELDLSYISKGTYILTLELDGVNYGLKVVK